MALFAGALGGSLLTPVLGMIPQAPGGPPNPFAPSGGGGSSTPTDPLSGLFSGIGNAFSSVKSKMPNMNLVLLVGGGVVLLVLLR